MSMSEEDLDKSWEKWLWVGSAVAHIGAGRFVRGDSDYVQDEVKQVIDFAEALWDEYDKRRPALSETDFPMLPLGGPALQRGRRQRVTRAVKKAPGVDTIRQMSDHLLLKLEILMEGDAPSLETILAWTIEERSAAMVWTMEALACMDKGITPPPRPPFICPV